jgi:tetratricopeptide (TPR) repeat protein
VHARSVLVLVVVALALALGRAHADPSPADMAAARTHVDTADREYKLGRFEQALAEYTAAYQLYPAPALLFNIGQCHRYLHNYERALFFYRGFLRDAPANAPNRSTVEDLLAQTQADLDAQRADAAKREEEATRRADEDARARADAARRADEDRRVAEARRLAELDGAQHPHQPAIYEQWWFWTAIGGAVAVGGTSLYLVTRTTTVEPSGSLGGLDRR